MSVNGDSVNKVGDPALMWPEVIKTIEAWGFLVDETTNQSFTVNYRRKGWTQKQLRTEILFFPIGNEKSVQGTPPVILKAGN